MNLVVVGAQWGDEGKGKIVDFLADHSDIVVRFSGGANAGHTIVTERDTYKLHLVPSGIIYPNKKVVLGTGMVIDPEALFSELDTLTKQGIAWSGRVLVSDRAHLVLPRYKKIDVDMERQRRNPLGTTGRGIGVTYSLKAHREGIRVGDIFEEPLLDTLAEEDRTFVSAYIERLRPMVIDVPSYIAAHQNQQIMYEGAQGILLDLDIGTYPFVSSGCSAAAGASLGGGIGPRAIDRIIGVFKAYTTRVGNGPFPTEFREDRDRELASTIREIGREYGVTTGRPRRCGYLDLVALRYACRTNSIDSLALTHLDVYDMLSEFQVCVAYKIGGKSTEDFPSSVQALETCDPVTKTFAGWGKPLGEITKFDHLPSEARDYIRFIEDYTQTNVDIVSIGYERRQTIIRRPLWTRA
ncbi:MAG TPA: adenylosuccinate synthase [Spirochaetia bacterium]|nr:adenylosuccinate synthase [Spirochaetia bacterium]